jgi:hypothetical protein
MLGEGSLLGWGWAEGGGRGAEACGTERQVRGRVSKIVNRRSREGEEKRLGEKKWTHQHWSPEREHHSSDCTSNKT